MTDIKTAFQRYSSSRDTTDFERRVADLAQNGALDRTALDSVIRELAVTDRTEAKSRFLDLFFYYVRMALADHDLTDTEMTSIRDLKRLFRIEEGDCVDLRLDEVAELLGVQMRRILADRRVDPTEALQKVRLQEAFDLGYDQFVTLTRPFVEEAVAEIFLEGTLTDGADINWMHTRLSALDTTYDFEAFLDKQIEDVIREVEDGGRGYEASLLREHSRSRHISQDVKDQVWRRDQGRCVECGGQERLEFDHIIPFARGGANTYRNVQLLCEACNRRKSDRIG